MNDENVQIDIRRLLKTFGVQADSAILHHLQAHPEVASLHLRVSLEDVTQYPGPGIEPLSFTVEGLISRGE